MADFFFQFWYTVSYNSHDYVSLVPKYLGLLSYREVLHPVWPQQQQKIEMLTVLVVHLIKL